MRRNGAGLASICILLTMVLVMISSTASLYFGMENTLRTLYPRGVNVSVSFSSPDGISDENIEALKRMIKEKAGTDVELADYRAGETSGLITEEGIKIDMSSHTDFSPSTFNNVGSLSVFSLEDYNHMMGVSETLLDDECLLYCVRTDFSGDTFTMQYGHSYKVKKILDDFTDQVVEDSVLFPGVYIVVNDLEAFMEPVLSMKTKNGNSIVNFSWSCGFDLDNAEQEIAAASAIRQASAQIEGEYNYFSAESLEENRAGFFQMYGSLFFLGIMLSIVFLLAAVLIIYYKQISEGYEDQSRFDIMQKVGMTKRDIRRSINSQMLTVFFLPLVFAGIHLYFAFPFLWKMLMLFGLNDMLFIILVMLICYAIFGVFYTLVYRITSNAYYSIVSGK